MNQPSSPPSVGLVAGKYQLVQMIGRGGMGSVWEARHASLGTRFAIKFIESEYADSQEARKRFDNEAKAAATIQSKHAIQIYDHGVTDDGKPYIVMELLVGQPLDKRIEQYGALTLQDTATILQQVCRGLARAHERGIIHRDLKPENIFIVRDPEDGQEIAKVLDFGIAKLSNAPGQPGLTSSTKTGAVLGTPFYMSPEQARGLRNVDHRTDIWSLGVIAFKCVTGRLPFDGESVGDLLVKICTSPIPVPSHAVPGLPPDFDAVFMRALEREPERRYTSVSEFADGLVRAAGMAPARSSQASNPNSFAHGATAAVPSGGAITPQGLGPPAMVPTPAPMQSPFGASGPQGYNQPQGYATGGARTPNPAGMTNAPFTSSQPVPGVPSGGGKGKLFAIAGLMLVLGAGGALAALKMKSRSDAANAGLTQASAVVTTPPSTAPPTPPPADSTTGAGAATIAVNTTPQASAAVTVAKGTTPKTPITHTTATHTTPATTASAATPVTTASAKKPATPPRSKDDPGY